MHTREQHKKGMKASEKASREVVFVLHIHTHIHAYVHVHNFNFKSSNSKAYYTHLMNDRFPDKKRT